MVAGEADGAKAKLSTEYRECQDSGFQTTDAARHAQSPEGTGFSPPVCNGWAICGAEMWLGAADGGLWSSTSWGRRRLQSELRIYYIISPTSSMRVSSVPLFPMAVQFKYHLSITVCNRICGSGCTFLFYYLKYLTCILYFKFILSFKLWQNTHKICRLNHFQFVPFGCLKNFHAAVQTSPPSIFRTLFILQNWNWVH